jgi:hypothetical protein
LIATYPYPHKNGSHKGITPNKLLRTKVSTPVLTKIYSIPNMIINPRIKIRSSFGNNLITKAILIITRYIAVSQ